MSCCKLVQVSPASFSGRFFGNIDYIFFDFKSTIHTLSSTQWFRPTNLKPYNDIIMSQSELLCESFVLPVFNVLIVNFSNFDTLSSKEIDALYHSIHNLAEVENISAIFAVNTYKVNMQGLNGVFDLWGFDRITPNISIKDMNSKPVNLEFDIYKVNHLSSI